MASRSAKKKMQIYNAQGSKAVDAAEDETGEFKKGGRAKHAKRKDGGMVDGAMAKKGGHKPRVHKRAAGGKTPYSSGHSTSMPDTGGKTETGHEGQRPPMEGG